MRFAPLFASCAFLIFSHCTLPTASVPDGSGGGSGGGDGVGLGTAGYVVNDLTNDHDSARAVTLDTTGRILVAGDVGAGTGSDFGIIRYSSEGVFDTTFGTDGLVATEFGDESIAFGVHEQLDGSILVAGRSCDTGATNCSVAIARYTTAGLLDTTYNSTGQVLLGSGLNANYEATALTTDGKLYVGGDNLYRLLTNGSLDTSFATDGMLVIGATAYGLEIVTDGLIALGGVSSNDFYVARLTTAGLFDTSFGTGGELLIDIGSSSTDSAKSLTVQTDGQFVLGGVSDGKLALARVGTDGALDTTFGSDGTVVTTTTATASKVLMSLGDRIIIVAYSDDFVLGRFLSSGTLDPSFGLFGAQVTAISSEQDSLYGATTQSNGKLLAVGASGDTNAAFVLARYTTKGNIDTGSLP